MTQRERWLAVLNGEVPDRVPMDYRATKETDEKLMRHLGCATMSEVFKKLHIDEVVTVGPKYIGPPIPPDEDIYGIGFRDVEYEGGVYREAVRFPLASCKSVEEIEAAYRWPSPDWYDYSVLPEQVRGKEDCVIRGGGSECFDIYRWLRGEEQGYIDLVEHPDIAHYCLKKLYDFRYEVTRRIYETIPGRIIWTWVAEDLASQRGLNISLEQVEEFILPHMKRMIELVHQAGAYAFHHSDGAMRANLPNMVRIGIDVLDPVQWRCDGMDREEMKRQFGDRIAFHGAMDNQYTLAFGSVEEVRREVEDNIRILGRDGGYILGPCHNIQVISPPENIVAMYEAAYALGHY